MKRSSLIMVVAGIGLVVCAGELFARGGGGGGRGGFGGGRGGFGGRSFGGHSHGGRSFGGHARPAASRSFSPRAVHRAAPARTVARPAATRTTARPVSARTGVIQRATTFVPTARLAVRYAAPGNARVLLPLTARIRTRLGGAGIAGGGAGGDGSGGEEATGEEEAEALYGMEILEMEEGGTAQNGGMKVGDIILAVNGMATSDFDSMRAALESCGAQAEFEFINVENGQAERIELSVDESRIGTTVEQVQVQ